MERCAKKRGSKQLAPDDLFFVIRHHRSVFNKSIRIANWKHMYKVARDISENTADDVMEDESRIAPIDDDERLNALKCSVEYSFSRTAAAIFRRQGCAALESARDDGDDGGHTANDTDRPTQSSIT